jgi:hypothetical protein
MAVDGLRGLNARLSTDDAPVWAEVLGSVLVFGLLYRGASHIVAAMLAGVDPHVAGNDVSAANAVAAVRDDGLVMVDLYGRLLAVAFGILWLHVFDPGDAYLYAGTGGALFRVVITANIAVCLIDPLLFAYGRFRHSGVITNG